MLRTFSLSEVEQHTVATGEDRSVWLVVHDKVYDVTHFMEEHPGGKEILMMHAGTIATRDFEDMGHSTDARELMKSYCIGELNEADRVELEDQAPRSWDSSTQSAREAAKEGASSLWLFPVILAIAATVLYRVYMDI